MPRSSRHNLPKPRAIAHWEPLPILSYECVACGGTNAYKMGLKRPACHFCGASAPKATIQYPADYLKPKLFLKPNREDDK